MDWAEALRHLPQKVAVADRKGRVLLLSAEIPGMRVGRSFLKLCAPDAVMVVGRAAKKALADWCPKRLDFVRASHGAEVALDIIPFESGDGVPHLLVLVSDTGISRSMTPATAARQHSPSNVSEPTPQYQVEPVGTRTIEIPEDAATPSTAVRTSRPLRQAARATELVVVAGGGTMPLARALEEVLSDRIKTRAWPVARYIDALVARTGGEAGPAAVSRSLDPTTRVLYVGDSPYSSAIQTDPDQGSPPGSTRWAISGHPVRCAAVWSEDVSSVSPADLVADLQFEMMEVVRKAMPIRRRGRIEEVPMALRHAAAFLEKPAAMDMTGDLNEQARHHLLVMSIARFLQDGLDKLLGT